MKKKRNIIMITLVILFAIIVTTTMTFGKYIYNSVWDYYLSSVEFYFESDLLDINTKNNSLLKWDGSNIDFIIKNSINKELISEYDIEYKVTCEVLGDEADYIKCILNDTNSSTFNGTLASEAKCTNSIDSTDVSKLTKAECEVGGYTWTEEVASKNNYFNLVLTDETKSIDEVSVKITAQSTSPYSQTLIGIFNLNKVENQDIELITSYESYSDYDELTLTNTTDTSKCVSISFSADNYSIDIDTESVLNYDTDENKKINQIEIELTAKQTSFYNFYKINSEKVYSINDIIVEEKEC